jgi:hypothetical protein
MELKHLLSQRLLLTDIRVAYNNYKNNFFRFTLIIAVNIFWIVMTRSTVDV